MNRDRPVITAEVRSMVEQAVACLDTKTPERALIYAETLRTAGFRQAAFQIETQLRERTS